MCVRQANPFGAQSSGVGAETFPLSPHFLHRSAQAPRATCVPDEHCVPRVPYVPPSPHRRRVSRWAAWSAWAGLLSAGNAWAQGAPADPTPSTVLEARELSGRADVETVAEGDVELRRGSLTIQADRLSYRQPEDRAVARGQVRVQRDGDTFFGPELQITVSTFEGFFLSPTYFIERAGAGGSAERMDFLGRDRVVATRATYSSCPADESGGPGWQLSARRVTIDVGANEGVAEGAVLRFLGVPLLAFPVLSFPVTGARKSGWLPPSINLDSRSGLQLAVPYYWNIAPNRDATLTPAYISRRGAGLESEYRYLAPQYGGSAILNLLPGDRVAGRDRYGLNLMHDAVLRGDTALSLHLRRVSDDDYWKDFSDRVGSLTPRLLLSDVQLGRPLGGWSTYARAMRWQVLQSSTTADAIEAPYERLPQIGARTLQRLGGGVEWAFEGEFNRFARPVGEQSAALPEGLRLHALGSISRRWASPGWSIVPRLSVNAAAYAMDQPFTQGPDVGRQNAARLIPTLSLDSAWMFERQANWFGRDLTQTLEPRLLYVNTPYRDQTGLPNFDATPKDFNFDSIYTENAFSGVDRVSDAHQLTAGAVTRLLDPATGVEKLRLGVVQRYLFRDQRITAEGTAFTQRLSDVLLLASSNVIRNWTMDASLQYNPDVGRIVRSIVGARYSPGPFRTVNATYRLARGLSEQVEWGWQWPVYGPGGANSSAPPWVSSSPRSAGSSGCRGTLYSVGRVNYSVRDSRITDSIVGLEYDAGCWVGRLVAERLSTGQSEATTRLMVQLELVGLSRLGSNPLQVLKDNIPGYRLLRNSDPPSAAPNPYD